MAIYVMELLVDLYFHYSLLLGVVYLIYELLCYELVKVLFLWVLFATMYAVRFFYDFCCTLGLIS